MKDSIFSNDSNTEDFFEDYLNNIPEDSGCSDEEDNFENDNGSNSPPLELEVKMKFLTWKSAYEYIKKWSLQQGFMA